MGTGSMSASGKAIFSVDVEDWFHILDLPSTPKLEEWERLPSCVERNFRRLLQLFSEAGVHVTCFFLGWVGERFPHLVREAHRAGHEIASHGYAHRLVYSFQPHEFREDAARARKVLEDVAGVPVLGYRSAGFSVTEETPWFFDELLSAGYQYDSSVFPSTRAHGGINGARRSPLTSSSPRATLAEVPITLAALSGKSMCCLGGG